MRRAAIVLGAIVIVAGAGIALVNPRITRYVESDAFRAELEKQTAKGLHFPAGMYSPIRRTGFLSAEMRPLIERDPGVSCIPEYQTPPLAAS